jgi:6,7-dimethyl-8-ribityllumazine synthase
VRDTHDGREAREVLSGAAGCRFALVVSRFNDSITVRLRDGARAALAEAGAAAGDVEEFSVPGAFELPQVARGVAETGLFDAIVALGCVIRGETPHFEYLSTAVAHGLMSAAGDTGVPMTFGVLTTDTLAQATARAGDGRDNKGFEAAAAAIDMAKLFRALRAAAFPEDSRKQEAERGSASPPIKKREAERGSGAPASAEPGGVQGSPPTKQKRGAERGSGAPASAEPGGVQGSPPTKQKRGAERGSGAPASAEPGGVQGSPPIK